MGTIIPSGTTQARPVGPAVGTIRFNTTVSMMETWDGASWKQVVQTAVGGYKFEFSERAVHGETYSVVEPIGHIPWEEMTQWCNETLGPTADDGVWTANVRWYVNNSKFWFRDERDRTMFVLKWAQ
jgi:hypothetical protein